jgi:Xaa-Pro aminopeptidase
MLSQDRIKSAQKTVKDEGLDAFIVSGNSNNYYLAGIADNTISNAFCSIITKNDFYFVATSFHAKQLKDKLSPKNIRLADGNTGFGEIISGLLKDSGKVGFESDQLTYGRYLGFKKLLKGKTLVPAKDMIEQIRKIKDAQEFAAIKKAAAITDKTFIELLKLVKPGVSELFLKRKVLEIMQDLGAQGCSFDPIVASGKNSADPHYEGTNKKIREGEMVVIDIGARYKNYNADMTRTVFIGKAPEKYKNLYQIVLESQEKALAACKTGAPCRQCHLAAADNFEKYGQEQFFTTAVGHGVGIDIHELPYLSPYSKDSFQNGIVFAVEPGLYLVGWGGIRIEDLCAIQNGKCVILSKSPKKLIEIK